MSMSGTGDWNRRDFLKSLSLGAATLPLLTRTAQAGTPSVLDGGLPVAHWAGLEADRRTGEAPGRVLDARRLKEGNSHFLARAARLTLHGIYPAEEIWAYTDWQGFQVDVIHDPDRNLRHMAWSCDNRRGANISAGVSVRVPVSADHGLCLAGTMENRQGGAIPFAIRLTAGREAGLAKLQPGLYLAALVADHHPAWRSYRLDTTAAGDAGRRLYRHPTTAGQAGQVAPFPYLAFSIDFADQLKTAS